MGVDTTDAAWQEHIILEFLGISCGHVLSTAITHVERKAYEALKWTLGHCVRLVCVDQTLTILALQGKLFVRGDSKIFRFQNGKTESLFLQRKNPRRIAWTVLCRRQRRKGITEVCTNHTSHQLLTRTRCRASQQSIMLTTATGASQIPPPPPGQVPARRRRCLS